MIKLRFGRILFLPNASAEGWKSATFLHSRGDSKGGPRKAQYPTAELGVGEKPAETMAEHM